MKEMMKKGNGMDCMKPNEMKSMMKKDMGFYGHHKVPKVRKVR